MDEDKTLSIIVPTYNRSALLDLTLQSLCHQNLPTALFEVIVSDDGSSDNTQEVVKNYSKKLDLKYIWQKDEGYKVAQARNKGAEISRGKYIIFLDSGILLSSVALENILRAFLVKGDLPKAIIGMIHGFGIEDDHTLSEFQYLIKNSVDECLFWLKEKKLLDPRTSQFETIGRELNSWPAPFDLFWGGLMGIAKSEFEKVGGFDSSYSSWGGEDVELGIRLFLSGCEFILAEGVESVHWPHKTESNLAKELRALQCAKELHRKYGLWQTEYYLHNEDNTIMTPLNIMIENENINLNLMELSHAELR